MLFPVFCAKIFSSKQGERVYKVKPKHGFTLIELVVVMSIIAILSVIGVSALIAARNESIVDSAAETLVSTIRDARNRSMAVTTDKSDNQTTPSAWLVKISGGSSNATQGFELQSIKGDIGALTNFSEESNGNNQLINNAKYSISIANSDKTTIVSPGTQDYGYIVFRAPLGRATLLQSSTINDSCIPGTDSCKWQPSGFATNEYIVGPNPITGIPNLNITSGDPNVITLTDNSSYLIKVDISFGGSKRTLLINANGDVNVI